MKTHMCTVGVVSSIWGVTFPLVLASVAGHFATPHHRGANAFAIFVVASLHGGVVWQGPPASYALPAAGKFLERSFWAEKMLKGKGNGLRHVVQ